MKILAAIFCVLIIACIAKAQQPGLITIAEKEKRLAAMQADKSQVSVASNNFKVHFYECTWQADPDFYFITGKVTAHFIVTQQTSSIVYDLSKKLVVDSVFVNGATAGFKQNADNSLAVTLPGPYNKNDTGNTTIFYHGEPPADDEAFVTTKHGNAPVLWTLSEPYGAKDWWPCRNGLDDKADSIDIYLVHPAQYKATTNGVLQSETTVNDTTTTYFKHRYPIASYLVGIAISNYSVFTQTVQLGSTNLPVTTYAYPESVTDFQNRTSLLIKAMKVYYDVFGDYPFKNEQYGQTQFSWGGGMEHQTNSFVTGTGENLMAHELAHQWFGDKVTCASWQDIWLNEGFAEYLADFLYTEKTNSIFYTGFVRDNLASIVSLPGGQVWVKDTSNFGRIFDGRLTYSKGAFLLRMLRWTLGDSAFFNGVRNYLNDPKLKYSFARTSDLQKHLEATGHTDLTYFFDQWFYGQGYPTFAVQWQQDVNNKAKVTINQTTSANINFFKVPLALTFSNATQNKTFIVNDTINNLEAQLNIGFEADTVFIDPDKQLISKNNISIKLAKDTTTIPVDTTGNTDTTQHIAAIMVSPNPFTSRLNVRIKYMQQQRVVLQLYDALGKKLLEQTATVSTNDETISLAIARYLAAGLYFFKIDSGETHLVKKILKTQ